MQGIFDVIREWDIFRLGLSHRCCRCATTPCIAWDCDMCWSCIGFSGTCETEGAGVAMATGAWGTHGVESCRGNCCMMHGFCTHIVCT